MAEFDPYYKWLGIPRREQPPHHYRILGIDLFESDKDVIQTAADRQMAYVQKCANGPQQHLSQKILNELSAARVCLLSDAKRQAYDQKLKKKLEATNQAAVPVAVESELQSDPFGLVGDDDSTSSSSIPASRKSPLLMPLMIASGVAIVVAAGGIWYLTRPLDEKPAPVAKADQPRPTRPGNEDANPKVAGAKTKPIDALANTQDKLVADAGTPKPVQQEVQPQAAQPIPNPIPVEQPKPESQVASVVTPTPASIPGSQPSSEPEKSQPEKPDPNENNKKPGTSAKPKQTAKKPNPKDAPNYELVNLPFNSVSRKEDDPADPDELPGGNAGLPELLKQAGEANKECVAVSKECRPLFVERQTLMVQLVPRREAMLQSEFALKQIDAKLKVLAGRVRLESTGDPLNTQEDNLREDRGKVNGVFETARNEVATRTSRIEAIDNTLVGLSDRMRKRWEELNDCRRQWLSICRPHDKYARADFEGAQRVINEWLKVDEMWADAFIWGALATYELGDYPTAIELVEKAETLREEVLRAPKPFPQIEAIQGLVALQTQGQRSKSAGLVQKAISHADKDSDWQTYFIAGRASEETGRLDGKAKVFLERALKIDPECHQAAYFLGRLQTTSTEKSVHDVDSAIKLLESAWTRTGKRSWRIGFALVKAYDAAKRGSEASQQWSATLALAPAGLHEQLTKERGE